jgi:hypothetical protein
MKDGDKAATMVMVRQRHERERAFVIENGIPVSGRSFHGKWPERAKLVDNAGEVGRRMESMLTNSKQRPKSIRKSDLQGVFDHVVSECVRCGLALEW